MGAERELSVAATATFVPTEIVGLQPSAMVDHVAIVDWSLLDHLPGDRGGSQQVAIDELRQILSEVKTHILPSVNGNPIRRIAGGSIANTIRGLSKGFRISGGIIGARGDDDEGRLFVNNMSYSGVDLSKLRLKKGHTSQCACLVDEEGNRTMRPCLLTAAKLHSIELMKEDFKGSKWLVLRYSIFNMDEIRTAIRMAKEEALKVSMDLASFEMVRDNRMQLMDLLESGNIDLCFANEDEARELMKGEPMTDPESALAYLSKHCRWAVVTLGSKGCIARHGKEIVRVPAIGQADAIDATGAGDLFASGFLYGLVKGLPLEDCCKIGSCSGGSVTRALGGEVMPDSWQWMCKQLQSQGLSSPQP